MARYGLVVGVAKYKSPLGNLSKTEGDAKAVNDLLKQHGDFEDIQVLTGEVTAKQLEEALGRLLLERADRNEALIYFSGHAVVVKGNFGKKRGYFALSNTGLKTSSGEITGIENGIALDDLSGLIGEAKLSNLVVLLDCCHSETLLEESQGFLQRAIVSQAFAELKQDYFLVSACRKFEEAYAMKSESYSIFTGAMLRGLAKERANDRGVVDASTMFGYVAEQLRGTGQEAVSFGYGRALRIVDYRAVVGKSEIDETCPYVGLNAFDEKTAQWFFGRDEALRRLREKLGLSPFAFVVGVSGSGKSSLVRAKLMPEWANQVFVMKPRTSPLGQLKTVLTATLNDADQDQIEAIEDWLDGGDLLAAVELMPKKPILLVIDQFEEVFTLCRQKTEQRKFLKMLADVAQTANVVDLAIVATMRADFLGECTDANLDKIINEQMVWLSPMNEDEFREAIVKPAQEQRYELGEGLLDAILADIENEPNCLPLLEFALQELWAHRDQQTRKLTYAAYRNDLKGIKGALNLHADRLYASQSESKQKWMRRILLSLLQMGQDVKDTRQPKKRKALVAYGQDDTEKKEIEAVLRALEGDKGRLLIAYEEDGVARVDLAHEALMEGWEKFKEWRLENRVVRRLADRVEKAWEEWIGKGKNEDYFLQSGLMLEVRGQWEQIAPELAPMVRDYYQLSEQHSTDRVALIERNLTEIKLREDAMRVANSISFQRENELLAAIQNAGESLEKLKTILNPVQANLQRAMEQIPLSNICKGHDLSVLAVAFSPDGKAIVSGSLDNTLRLWDLQGNPIGLPFQGHGDWVRSVAFSPDGRLIVSGSKDKTLRLWDLQGNPIGQAFQGHEGWVNSVAFSPDGRLIVSGSWDKTLRLWDLQGNQIRHPFLGHQHRVNSVAFSPDGKTIVSGSWDKTLRLWDLQGNQIGLPFQGDGFYINSVAFSPDGKTIVSGSDDNTLRLWDLQGNQIGAPFQGHESRVRSVAFSPDGKTIVSGSDDKTLRLWDLQGNQIGAPFQGHEGYVRSVAFSPDGKLIVSGSWDKTLLLWDLQGNQIRHPFLGHQDRVNSVAFSPDGKLIVSGSWDRTLRLWDLQGNQIRHPFQGHESRVWSVAFSPDGQTIVSGSQDHKLRLWDLKGNQIGLPFKWHEDTVFSVAFSPDGKAICSASADKTLRLWHGGGEAWLEVCCNRLRYHPVFKNPPDDLAREACEVCRKYVWEKEKVER